MPLRRSRRWPLVMLLLCLPACTVLRYPKKWDPGPLPGVAAPPPPGTQVPGRPSYEFTPGDTESMLEFARSLIGSRGPLVVGERRFPFDCSGYVSAVYYHMGEDLMALELPPSEGNISGTEIIYLQMLERGRIFKKHPRPGDLVFFDNTWDRDGDGELNDPFTHIGVVHQVLPDDTVEILHLGNSGIAYLRMNLKREDEARDAATGEVLNDQLRRRSSRDGNDIPYLSAQLFRAFGRLN